MKQSACTIATILLLAILSLKGICQPLSGSQKEIDSLRLQLSTSPLDTNRAKGLVLLARMHITTKPSLALNYANEALLLSKKLDYQYGSIISLQAIIFVSAITGQWQKATESVYRGLEICENYYPVYAISFCDMFALIYEKQNNNQKRLEWLLKAYHHPLFKTASPSQFQGITYYNLGEAYDAVNKLDSAQYCIQKANQIADKYNLINLKGFTSRVSGRIAARKHKYQESLFFFHKSLNVARQQNNYFFEVEDYLELAETFHKINQADSAIYYAELALKGSQKLNNNVVTAAASKVLGEEFEIKKPELSVGYFKNMIAANDSLYNIEKLRQAQHVVDVEQQRISDLKAAKIEYDHTIRQNTLFGILSTLIILSLVLIRNNSQKQKANKLLENTLTELKQTQQQLIQKEKLASLGELTAGIAHEIQNPLNFVNNFSEVSTELVSELKEKATAGHTEDVLAIADELAQNLQKITHHGGRASNIVKGMLEHSRTTTGERQPTDLNALAEEYLRLAYQGQRAKDKDFNTTLVTDFAPNLDKANVVPQEIGRVLLNLFNNSFYAVQQRAKQGEAGYEPVLRVSTECTATSMCIRVQDNGTGMPEAVRAKIFQPFFTTKPTGEGTGLGLSLSYDIITKGHGGTLTVESTAGEGTTFTVQLPLPN